MLFNFVLIVALTPKQYCNGIGVATLELTFITIQSKLNLYESKQLGAFKNFIPSLY